jgi:hypothetical protein
MNYYTHGGLANVAQTLAKQGRHGDTQLIHVSPKELHGLQALAAANGTSITINPDTGLPEAFNFKKLIPMAAGAALTIGSGGTLTPLTAGMMVGAGYGIATGSIKQGLMAGIGAYGGAGLGAGLAEAGASSLAETGAVAPTPAFQEVAGNQLIPTEQGNLYLPNGSAQSSVNIGPNVPEEFAPFAQGAPSAVPPPPAAPFGQSVSNVGKGIEGLGNSAGRSLVYEKMPFGTLPALATTALDASQKERPSVPGYQEDEYDRRLKGYKLSPNYQAYTAPTPNPYYRPTYAAIGGIMNSNAPHSFDDESGSDNVGMAAGGMNMASGGIAGLGGYSDGGRMLKGPGDGMSDSIPGVIGGKQPARLADGEFVVPADVVSHLGNGSTDAGAKKLYSMMDKVRQARTGKKKQAPQVDMTKYMPIGKASGGIAGYAEGGIVGYAEGGDVSYNSQLAANVQAAYNQGYSGAQIGAALIASGVDQATAAAATGLSAGVIAQAYAGGAALTAGGGGIGSPAGPARNTAVTTTTTPVTSVTPATSAPVNINTTGPGGYTIPTFPPGAIASYIKTQGITTPAQFEQLKLIFNVNDAQIATAQNLIKNNDPIVDATTAKYYADIKANPGQVAQNASDFAARAAQLGISTKDLLIKPTVEVPIKPIEPLVPVVPTVTPQSTPTTGPLAGSSVYRPNFVPRTSGINMSSAIQDPYSNQGLQSLYSQMMGQYAKPTPQMSDAEVKALAERAFNSGGGGAEVGRQLINAGIPVKQAISALRSYSGITPEIVNQAYIGGQSLGTTPPPTLNTQYNYSDPATYYKPPAQNNLILTTPIVDAAFKTPVAADTSGIGGRLAAAVDNSNG